MPLVISQPRYVRGLSRGYTKVKVVVIVEKRLEVAKIRLAKNRLSAHLLAISAAVARVRGCHCHSGRRRRDGSSPFLFSQSNSYCYTRLK